MSELSFKTLLASILVVAWTTGFASGRTMSPNLRLIANPAIARFGWRFAALGTILVLVPFYNPVLGVMLLGPSLLLAANNLERVWIVRSLGEARYVALLEEASMAGRLKLAIASFAGTGLLVAVCGGVLMLFSSRGELDWSYWFGMGLVCYGAITPLMRISFVVKLHRQRLPWQMATRAR